MGNGLVGRGAVRGGGGRWEEGEGKRYSGIFLGIWNSYQSEIADCTNLYITRYLYTGIHCRLCTTGTLQTVQRHDSNITSCTRDITGTLQTVQRHYKLYMAINKIHPHITSDSAAESTNTTSKGSRQTLQRGQVVSYSRRHAGAAQKHHAGIARAWTSPNFKRCKHPRAVGYIKFGH